MKKALNWAGFALALTVLILSVTNASWLAPDPGGAPKLIAHRGLYQLYDKTGVGRDTCTADRIYEPYHRYLENTVESVARARNMGAYMVEVDVAPTKDGELVVFHDWTLDCRTDGTGPVRDATLEELKALDIGHGYTADGGKTFPFRGQFTGAMPTFEDVVRQLPRRGRLMINFKSKDAGEADLLARTFAALGRDPAKAGDAFYGHQVPIKRIRELYPEAWAWSPQEAKGCSQDYVLYGWSGYVPRSCRGKTMIIPLDRQWAFWGWPNRLMARMEAYGGKIIVIGPTGENRPRGLTLAEQLTRVPSTFNGYIWIEDSFTILPALYPRFDKRSDKELAASNAALAKRRLSQ